MSKQRYTKKQIKELLTNPNVNKCSEKYISFTDNFKLKALELNKGGFFPKEIFKEFSFPEYIINSNIPKISLGRWRFNMKNKGVNGLVGNQKGRKNKKHDISKMSKDEYIEYLETKLAVLEELKKLTDGKYP